LAGDAYAAFAMYANRWPGQFVGHSQRHKPPLRQPRGLALPCYRPLGRFCEFLKQPNKSTTHCTVAGQTQHFFNLHET